MAEQKIAPGKELARQDLAEVWWAIAGQKDCGRTWT